MNHEELKMNAVNFGFDASWVADILDKWGAELLALAIEAARNGFSVGMIVELINKLGPALLELMVELLNRKKMMMSMAADGEVVPGPVVEGIDGAFLDIIIEKYLPMIIEKYLPLILEKYGSDLIKTLIKIFLDSLQK